MEQLSVQAVLGLIGMIILIGLGGEVLFKKTGVPSVLFLVVLGVVLGPILGLTDMRNVTSLAPYFGTLALLIILFDGGLNLHLIKALKEAPMALVFTVLVFSLTVAVTAGFYRWGLHGQWAHGILLGAIIGGSSGAIVIPIVSKLDTVREPTKVLLSLESAFTDVFVVVMALAVMGTLTSPEAAGHVVGSIIHAFVDALLLAVIAGVLWARLLAWLQGETLSYMLTLAAIFLLYDIAELVGANGAITILLFGLVLGNMEQLVRKLAAPIRRAIGYELKQAEFQLDEFIKRLNEELAFLVRTFFYVLLGLIFDLSAMSWTVAITGIVLFIIAVFARWAVTEVFAWKLCDWNAGERRVIISMLPRGVAAAVMAFLPSAAGVPNTELFPLYALSVIALSVVYMTIALTFEQRREPIPVPKPSSS